MKKLIIIPAFNEAENIVDVINDCKKHLPDADIVVINDGSIDNTLSTAQSQGVRVINHIFNLGIGGAVQTGFMVADREDYEVAVQFDGDGQHLASEIGKILLPINSGADIVIGSRFLEETGYPMPFFRKIGARVFSLVISVIFRNKITDTTSGFRAYGKRTIKLFSSSYPEDFPEVEALILAYKKGLNINEIPVKMRLRPKGKSSITPLKAVYYMIKVLLAVFVDLLKK